MGSMYNKRKAKYPSLGWEACTTKEKRSIQAQDEKHVQQQKCGVSKPRMGIMYNKKKSLVSKPRMGSMYNKRKAEYPSPGWEACTTKEKRSIQA